MELTTFKKMKTAALTTCSLLLVSSLFAVPAKNGAEPTAEGYPAWTGITPKNYIGGRVLGSNADLRHRVATVVIEIDGTKAAEHFERVGTLAHVSGFYSAIGLSANWETIQIPRDVLVICVVHNAKDRDAIKKAMKYPKDSEKNVGLVTLIQERVPVYEHVTFDGAPANGGKLPFVYVMGHEGKEPLLKEAFTAKTEGAVSKLIKEQRKKMSEKGLTWRQFYGFVAEPQFFGKDIEKAMAKGKPLDAVEAKIRKSVTDKDAEKAKEAQLLCDGLEQTRSDMMFLAQCSFVSSPHVAAYAMERMIKCWPKSKKQVSEIADKIKANSGAQPMIRIYSKVMEWSNPNFMCKNAGEAKKIKLELEKMKKSIAPLKEDKDVKIQNGALMIDGMLDELIATIEMRVTQK